jgi:hypothetical protein
MGITVIPWRVQGKMAFAATAVSLQRFIMNLHQADWANAQIICTLHNLSVQCCFPYAMGTVNAVYPVTMQFNNGNFWDHLNFLDDPTWKIV